MKTVDFYFDYGSPTAYLADAKLGAVCARHDTAINYLPVLLGGIFQATGNSSPVTVPAKGKYLFDDLVRCAAYHDIPFQHNPHFPINTLQLMRGAIAAQRLDCFAAYHAAVFKGIWTEGLNLGEADIIGAKLLSAGLDTDSLFALLAETDIKECLKTNTAKAVERGVFGAPTMFVGEEMFFGQDRVEYLERDLAG